MTMWPAFAFCLGGLSPVLSLSPMSVLCWVFLVVIVVTIFLPVAVYIFILNLLYGPPGIFTLDLGFAEVFQLLI